jgi:hypothetical protein
MVYKIEYFKDGTLLFRVPWSGSVENTAKEARDGLARHAAEFARITDGQGVELEIVKIGD